MRAFLIIFIGLQTDTKMYKDYFKLGFDLLVGLLLSIFTFPLLLVIMILIRLDSKGSPLFLQTRVGKHGKHFRIFKLRTMIVAQAPGASFSTAENDPRITPIGKLLRKTSLDELPQCWNILLGDMSLIGPRPDVPAQRSNYTEKDWIERHQVRPGITGLAQSLLRSSATAEQRLELDLKYAEKVSFLLDLKIIIDTVRILTKGSSAN